MLIRSWCNRDRAEPHLELLGAVIVAARKLRQLPLKMSQRNSRRQSTTGQPAVPQNPLEEVPQYEDMIAQYEDMIAQLEDRIVQLEEEHSNEIEELNLDLADERTRLREAMEDVTQFLQNTPPIRSQSSAAPNGTVHVKEGIVRALVRQPRRLDGEFVPESTRI